MLATSLARSDVRRTRGVVGALAAGSVGLAVATGIVPPWLILAGGGLLSIANPLALVGGLLRLVRTHGSTLQAVAGALAIYLLVGLVFSWLIGLVARFDPGPYLVTVLGVLIGSFARR